MRPLYALLLMCLPALPFAQPADLAKDERLNKKIDARLSTMPLKKALRELEKSAGVGLDLVTSLDDLKVTVLCKEEPASLILVKLADVLGCEWVVDGPIYRLRMDADRLNQRRAYVEAEERMLRKKVEEAITALAKERPLETPKPSTGPERLQLGTMFKSMSSGELASFWRGDTKTFVTVTGAGPNVPPVRNESTRVFARYDSSLHTLNTLPGIDAALIRVQLLPLANVSGELANLPFAKDVRAWGTGIVAESKEDERFLKVVPGVSTPRENEPKRALGAHLERFFDSTGIAVVSDAFRTATLAPSEPMAASSWVGGVAQQNRLFLKVSDGVAQFRHGGFWRLRKFEIPEPTLERFETLNAKEALSLAQYAAFIAKLTANQLAGLRWNGWAIGIDLSPIRTAAPAIALYNALTPSQRARASQGGLAATQLPASLQVRFVDVMLRGVLENRGSGEFVGAAASGDLREVGLMIEETLRPEEKTFRILLGVAPNGAVAFTGTSQVQTKPK